MGPCARWCATAAARTEAGGDRVFGGGGGTEDGSPDVRQAVGWEKRLAAVESRWERKKHVSAFCFWLPLFLFFFFFFLKRGIG